MKVLITGGFGFIGARLGKLLLERGYEVRLGSRLLSAEKMQLLPGAEFVTINWESDKSLEEACSEVMVVVHAAGMNAPDCARDPVAALSFNGVATARLARAACKTGSAKLIYLSTAHVYSSPLEGEITENTCPTNLHPYATSHLAGENVVLGITAQHGVNGLVIRLSNAFGAPVIPGTDCWMLFVNDLCRKAVETGTLEIRTNSLSQRDFIPMETVCSDLETLIASDHPQELPGILNIGSGESMTLLDMAELIQFRCEVVLGFKPKIKEKASRLDQMVPLIFTSGFAKTRAIKNAITAYLSEIDSLLLFCKKNFK